MYSDITLWSNYYTSPPVSVERVGWQLSDKPDYIILCLINNCQVNNLYVQ